MPLASAGAGEHAVGPGGKSYMGRRSLCRLLCDRPVRAARPHQRPSLDQSIHLFCSPAKWMRCCSLLIKKSRRRPAQIPFSWVLPLSRDPQKTRKRKKEIKRHLLVFCLVVHCIVSPFSFPGLFLFVVSTFCFVSVSHKGKGKKGISAGRRPRFFFSATGARSGVLFLRADGLQPFLFSCRCLALSFAHFRDWLRFSASFLLQRAIKKKATALSAVSSSSSQERLYRASQKTVDEKKKEETARKRPAAPVENKTHRGTPARAHKREKENRQETISALNSSFFSSLFFSIAHYSLLFLFLFLFGHLEKKKEKKVPLGDKPARQQRRQRQCRRRGRRQPQQWRMGPRGPHTP